MLWKTLFFLTVSAHILPAQALRLADVGLHAIACLKWDEFKA